MNRCGKSLLELVVVIGLMGLLLATTATTLVGLVRTERQIRRDVDQQTMLARLAARWRADAHAASRLAPVSGSNSS